MTQFPITAELTIKGLVRPAMLMTYVRINAFFYGQRHISSGLYVITKQVDTVNGTGYRTVLTLVRIGGADDYITSITKEVKIRKPKYVYTENSDGLIKTMDRVKSEKDSDKDSKTKKVTSAKESTKKDDRVKTKSSSA